MIIKTESIYKSYLNAKLESFGSGLMKREKKSKYFKKRSPWLR